MIAYLLLGQYNVIIRSIYMLYFIINHLQLAKHSNYMHRVLPRSQKNRKEGNNLEKNCYIILALVRRRFHFLVSAVESLMTQAEGLT